MANNYEGNNLVRKLVILIDLLVLNCTIWALAHSGVQFFPDFLRNATKLMYFVANVSLFVGEYKYSTIIHIRKVGFPKVLERTFCLACLTTAVLFVSLRLLASDSGSLVGPCGVFGISFYLALVVSRFCELNLLKYFRSRGFNRSNVTFVGNDPAIVEMYFSMTEEPSAGYNVKGYYADEPIANAPSNLAWLGTLGALSDIINSSINSTINGTPVSTDELVCCLSHDKSKEIFRIMHYCERNVIHFYYLPRQFGEYKLHLDAQYFMGKTVYSSHMEPLANLTNRVVKRTFDIVMSCIICLCTLPLLPIVALCIKIQSPGPLFFKQARTGINGNTFYIYKFRSMHVNKTADTNQATKDDPRTFAFGEFIRKTSIDEFPQFLNVLKGEMSIVGPRPHMVHHTEIYGSLIDKYMVRHFSKPGITGWAQVTGYRGETKELWQMEERVKRDIWYIENWSFWLDIRIMLLTVRSIFHPDANAY